MSPLKPASQIASTGDASDHRLFQSIWAPVCKEYLEVLDHRLFQSILGSETLVSWPQSAPAMTEAEAPPSPGAEVGHRINLFIALEDSDWLISLVNIYCYIVVEKHWIIGVCHPGCSDCPSGCCKGGRGGGLHKQSFDFDLKNKSAQVRIGAATSLACIAGDNPTISCHNIIRGILP